MVYPEIESKPLKQKKRSSHKKIRKKYFKNCVLIVWHVVAAIATWGIQSLSGIDAVINSTAKSYWILPSLNTP